MQLDIVPYIVRTREYMDTFNALDRYLHTRMVLKQFSKIRQKLEEIIYEM